MKKSQKGVTLVEVIVSITIFSIISLALFSSVLAMKSVITRQEEYVKLEMVCYDIKAHYIKNQSEWFKSYFNVEDKPDVGYLTSNFEPTIDETDASYIIEFQENNEELTISIYSRDRNITYIENVVWQKEVPNEEI